MAPLLRGSRPRHVPQRTCVACHQTDAKRQLVRLVRTPGGRVVIDPTGKVAGRGAYLCSSSTCWHTALKKNLLQRALKLDTVGEEDLQLLHEYAARLSSTPETVAPSARQP